MQGFSITQTALERNRKNKYDSVTTDTIADIEEFEEVVRKNSKHVVVLFANIKEDGTGSKIIKGNSADTNWTFEEAQSKLKYFMNQPDVEKGKVMYMFDMTDTPYFCLDCDMVSASACDEMIKGNLLFENSLHCAGTQKGYHMFYKKQDCWDMSGVKTKVRANKQFDLDLLTKCVLVDVNATFDGGIDEWDLKDMAAVFDDGLPKRTQPQQTGQVNTASVTDYVRDENHEVDLEKLSAFINQILEYDYGDWNVEFEAESIRMTHNSNRCLVDHNHSHSQPGHSALFFNKAQFPVVNCHSHGTKKLKLPAAVITHFKTLLGVKSNRDVLNDEAKKAEAKAKRESRRADNEEERRSMTEAGVMHETVAKKEFEKRVAFIRDRALCMELVQDKDAQFIYPRSDKQMRTLFANFVYQGENMAGKAKEMPYYDRWLQDPERREYITARMVPPGAGECPSSIYNLWTPYEITCGGMYNSVPEAWEMFQDLNLMLAGGNQTVADYQLLWLAYTLKYPARKTGTCLVFLGAEGCGKGTLMRFMEGIIGKNKTFETDDPKRDIWGSFNGALETSILICIEEISRQDMMDSNKLKDKITGFNVPINRKGEEAYAGMSYANYIIASNEMDPFTKLDESQRRYVISKTSTERKVLSDNHLGGDPEKQQANREYWKKMNFHARNYESLATIYHKLIRLPGLDEDTFPGLSKPVTDYEKDLQESNKPIASMFIEDFIANKRYRDCATIDMKKSHLYDLFKEFSNRVGVEYLVKQQKFSLQIKNMGFTWLSDGKTVRGCRHWKIDFNAGRKHFGVEMDYSDGEDEGCEFE